MRKRERDSFYAGVLGLEDAGLGCSNHLTLTKTSIGPCLQYEAKKKQRQKMERKQIL